MKKELKGLEHIFKELPDVAGQIAVDQIHRSFAKEQFQDKGKGAKWAPRKKDGNGARTERRALLVRSGDLLASWDYVTGNMEVSINTDKPYAQVHNEGGRAGRGAGFIMPKRKHAGPSQEINDAIEKHLIKEMDKLFS